MIISQWKFLFIYLFLWRRKSVESIYLKKRYAQGKAEQDPMCQSLQKHHFAYNASEMWATAKEEQQLKRTVLGISLYEHIQSEIIWEWRGVNNTIMEYWKR